MKHLHDGARQWDQLEHAFHCWEHLQNREAAAGGPATTVSICELMEAQLGIGSLLMVPLRWDKPGSTQASEYIGGPYAYSASNGAYTYPKMISMVSSTHVLSLNTAKCAPVVALTHLYSVPMNVFA
jgi:hypothetical protein